MSTGFYRVYKVCIKEKEYYKYKIQNKMLWKEIVRKDINELKKAVEEAGLLWGIVNLHEAQKHKGKHNIKKGTELFERQLTRRIRITEKAISQRQSNGMESLELLELLEEMKKIEENLKCTVSQ